MLTCSFKLNFYAQTDKFLNKVILDISCRFCQQVPLQKESQCFNSQLAIRSRSFKLTFLSLKRER